ncbi:MAG: hypothetical protein JO215_04245 [Ktedonobacteraceae bacterium]|nr:hypothetical protein [Ktedonobacteraceae bacterium]MBV9614365.1 hypothetical protein [Ktedonobacteraceae bacterium]
MSHTSEVAQLRLQIALELDAMRRGLLGISTGTARHAFIHARMERIGACQDTLANSIGEQEASQVVCTVYMQAMEQDTVCDAYDRI